MDQQTDRPTQSLIEALLLAEKQCDESNAIVASEKNRQDLDMKRVWLEFLIHEN
jgi:hypothetical protein